MEGAGLTMWAQARRRLLVRGLLVWILKDINEAIKRDRKSVFKYDRK